MDLITNLEADVVCAMTDKYPSEFGDEDRAYWLDIARRAIEEIRDRITRDIANMC